MNDHDSASAYNRSTAFGATAVGQVIALYDSILNDFRRAIAAVGSGEIERRVRASNHALVVIGELQSVLDFDRGGEAARHLNSLYNVARALITEASITNSHEKFLELISMFARVRAAWSHVERSVTASEPPDSPRSASRPERVFSPSAPVPPDSFEGPARGGWNA
jgi:flagellar secretion chaperone FliS